VGLSEGKEAFDRETWSLVIDWLGTGESGMPEEPERHTTGRQVTGLLPPPQVLLPRRALSASSRPA